MFNGKSVLITGGTGSFGQKFVETVLKGFPDIKRLVVYSRDEMKQFEMAQRFSPQEYPTMRYFIGDVRDAARLRRALEGIDIVVHAAALKQVPATEYNPFEAVKTNILGAQNVIEGSIDCGVQQVVALSTDKAAAPINLYGATKLCSDKLFTAANNFRGQRDIRFSVVRYGNVLGSRGSVVPFFLEKRKTGILPITDERMTRFNITLEDGVKLVLFALNTMQGGEIYVPKIPSYRITDLAEAIAPGCRRNIVGIRPGEKLHEEMITENDAMTTLEFGDYFIMLPTTGRIHHLEADERGGVPCRPGFRYNSGENTDWLSAEQLRALIQKHVDSNFTVAP